MDPNACLSEALEIAAEVQNAEDAEETIEDAQDRLARLSELVLAIDGWLQGDGFLAAPMGAQWRATKTMLDAFISLAILISDALSTLSDAICIWLIVLSIAIFSAVTFYCTVRKSDTVI